MSATSASPNFQHGYPTPGPQIATPQKVMDHVFFLSETDWKYAREQVKFDYIIIGSGFCALAFAERVLTEKPNTNILMIERGPFFLPEHFQNLPTPYQRTLGGLSETFPWTLSAATCNQPPGNIRWQHGMVPFFGGRSIMWSAWCPRPDGDKHEFDGWPSAVVQAAQRYYPAAERLLNVIPADEIDKHRSNESIQMVEAQRPVYGAMQLGLQAMLAENLKDIPSATRSTPAPLAAGARVRGGVDFAKFATPSRILELAAAQARKHKDYPLRIVTNCIVTRILHQDGRATALETSRGMVNVGDAEIILAMGTIPPTTLLLNSFPAQVQNAGGRFTAHFITSITARIPRSAFSFGAQLRDLELGAIYLAGLAPATPKGARMQYHVQLSVLSDKRPEHNADKAARYMPDVVATANIGQLSTSQEHLVFVCAVLGEMEFANDKSFLRKNDDQDPTSNITLQVIASETDRVTWDVMDEATFQMLEEVFAAKRRWLVEYWHADPSAPSDPEKGFWSARRPELSERRVDALVHEGSTLWIGEDSSSVVDLDYRPRGVENVYVTGGGLWPASGSWNPTLTMVALAQDLADKRLAAAAKKKEGR